MEINFKQLKVDNWL
jgi:ATP-dependent RNA helicase DDX49/DBP8